MKQFLPSRLPDPFSKITSQNQINIKVFFISDPGGSISTQTINKYTNNKQITNKSNTLLLLHSPYPTADQMTV
jgi:hypothetical protein